MTKPYVIKIQLDLSDDMREFLEIARVIQSINRRRLTKRKARRKK